MGTFDSAAAAQIYILHLLAKIKVPWHPGGVKLQMCGDDDLSPERINLNARSDGRLFSRCRRAAFQLIGRFNSESTCGRRIMAK